MPGRSRPGVEVTEVSAAEVPVELLLEADPSIKRIESYLTGSWCFAAKYAGEIIGACIVKPLSDGSAEVFNLAVVPAHQGDGVGSQLLAEVIRNVSEYKRVTRLELGTGAFGYQLAFYHRLGFRVAEVLKDYFIDNYEAPVFENGIQHRDMLRLYLDL